MTICGCSGTVQKYKCICMYRYICHHVMLSFPIHFLTLTEMLMGLEEMPVVSLGLWKVSQKENVTTATPEYTDVNRQNDKV